MEAKVRGWEVRERGWVAGRWGLQDWERGLAMEAEAREVGERGWVAEAQGLEVEERAVWPVETGWGEVVTGWGEGEGECAAVFARSLK